MATQRAKKGPAKIKRAGSRAGKIQSYYSRTYPKRKIMHLLKHNSEEDAKKWAKRFGYMDLFRKLAA